MVLQSGSYKGRNGMFVESIMGTGAISLLSKVGNYISKEVSAKETVPTDEYIPSEALQKFKDVVKKYDITSMTHDDLNKMSKELLDNGLITQKEYSFLSLDQSKTINDLQKIMEEKGLIIPGLADKDSGGKFNFMEIFKKIADVGQKLGDPKVQEQIKDIAKLA